MGKKGYIRNGERLLHEQLEDTVKRFAEDVVRWDDVTLDGHLKRLGGYEETLSRSEKELRVVFAFRHITRESLEAETEGRIYVPVRKKTLLHKMLKALATGCGLEDAN